MKEKIDFNNLEEFIYKNADKIKWEYLSILPLFNHVSMRIYEDFEEQFNWDKISLFAQIIPDEFLVKFYHKFEKNAIQVFQDKKFSNETIEFLLKNKKDLDCLATFQTIPDYLVEKYIDGFNQKQLLRIIKKEKLRKTFIKKNINKLEVVSLLLYQDMPFYFYKKNWSTVRLLFDSIIKNKRLSEVTKKKIQNKYMTETFRYII